MIREDYEAYSGEQVSFFQERQAHVAEEIRKIQAKLQNFEVDFFAGL